MPGRELDVTKTKWAAGILLAALAAPASAADRPEGIQIGMVQGMFRDVQPAMVQALATPLRDLIKLKTGLVGNVEILPDAYILADQIKAGRHQLGVFHGFEFAWIRAKNPDLVPLVITIPPGRKLQAVVVVHKDSKASTLADLKNEPVVVHRGIKAHCPLFLERSRIGLPATTAAPKTRPLVTAEEALDAVVQGDSPAALVDAAALIGYQTLQPGASKQLRVLCQSEMFPQTVIAYRKGSLDDETIARVRKLLVEAHQTAAGKPLMMLWSLKGFEDVPPEYSAHLDRIAKAFPPTPTAPISTAGGSGDK